MIIEDVETYINLLRNKKSFVIFIRHAEKKISENHKHDHLSLLTKKGHNDAKEFGKNLIKLLGKIALIKTSPIERCVQTAKSISQESNLKSIIQSKILGDPGVFVEDDKLAFNNFIDLGVKEVIERQLRDINLPGIRQLKKAIKLFFKEIITDLNQINGMGIYISHDAIIIPIIKYLTNDFIYSENLIEYLNGIVIWKDFNNNLFGIWNGTLYNFNEKLTEIGL